MASHATAETPASTRLDFAGAPGAYDQEPKSRKSARTRDVSEGEISGTIEEMRAQQERLAQAIAAKEHEHIQGIIAQIAEVVRQHNVPLEDLYTVLGKPSSRKGSTQKLEPKFRDPETGVTWSGRGKTPVWLRDKDPEDYRI